MLRNGRVSKSNNNIEYERKIGGCNLGLGAPLLGWQDIIGGLWTIANITRESSGLEDGFLYRITANKTQVVSVKSLSKLSLGRTNHVIVLTS